MNDNGNGASTALVAPPSSGFNPFPQKASTAVAETENRRAITEVVAALEVARRFPRDERGSMDRILIACTRPSLAEKALYAYSRGGSDITGPSIRMAETIAQCWGNFEFGWRELERRKGESSVEAFAWDMETNVRERRTFQIAHVIDTKKGPKVLTESRDIYEHLANECSRRMRACILGLIPADVVDGAVKAVKAALTATVNVTPELIEKLVLKFSEIGVPKAALEANIQRRIDTVTPALVLRLRGIYNSISDGMSTPADWFDLSASEETAATRTASVRDKLGDDPEPVKAAKAAPAPEAGETTIDPTAPAAPTEEDAAAAEAATLAAMSGPDLTKFLKAEAKRLKVDGDELDAIISDHGGWAKAKDKAVEIVATLRERASA